jgi:hypothetical protein
MKDSSHSSAEGTLVDVARRIGSTLGTVAATVNKARRLATGSGPQRIRRKVAATRTKVRHCQAGVCHCPPGGRQAPPHRNPDFVRRWPRPHLCQAQFGRLAPSRSQALVGDTRKMVAAQRVRCTPDSHVFRVAR